MGLAIFLKRGRETRLEKHCLLSGFRLHKVNVVWASRSETDHRRPIFLGKGMKIFFSGVTATFIRAQNFIECLSTACQALWVLNNKGSWPNSTIY